ncbi:synaptic vesicle transporter [Aspergillus ellipticus CBS 707.79]|uniref:Synaptic vesicle transporter n=1 Tax=Aspergillus ellipticus CBS 707.79 TaxID=1448320 RepID=A0A319F0M5_9EURO|nr:synaptic vesicle transporter [Aspergillus ellipticus CBS 707.79]
MASNPTTADLEKEAGREQVVQEHELNSSSNGSTKESQHQSQGQEDLPTSNHEHITVDWDGPDDPENPLNWSTFKKTRQLTLMACNTFITPLASSMFSPGIVYVMADFHMTSTMLGSFIVTVFLLGYVVGPFVIAPLSEIYGRVPVYHACNIFFLIFSIACAVAQSLPQLIIFRLLAGVGGVCPLTIGSGTVADMIAQEKRAGIMAVWALGPILGPVIGPVAGGFLSEAAGWRWVFWVLAIATGVITFACLLLYRESYAPVLLERKAARLRKETGNPNIQSKYYTGPATKQWYLDTLMRPIKLLVFSPIVLLLSLFAAVTYGYLYLMFTTITPIFKHTYGWKSGVSGLSYLGFGFGSMIGLSVCGIVSNRIAVKHTARGTFKPESRLPPMVFTCWLVPVGLFWYGWAAQAQTHWIVPILGTAVFAMGLMNVFMASNTYLVEAYLKESASVTAASTVLRSLVGAVLPLAGPAMYAKLGYGWGNSLLAFIALGMCGCPLLFWRYGERIRTHPRFQVRL